MDQIIAWLTTANIIYFFIKAFAISFSVIYFFYALIITREVQILNHTLIIKHNYLILFLALIEIVLGALLICLAFLYI